MRAKKWLWLALLVSPAPLFFNCHRALRFESTTMSSTAPTNIETALNLPGDPPQMNDGENQEVERSKVELDRASVVQKTGVSQKAGSEAVVAAGERLFALIDNSCLRQPSTTTNQKISLGGSLSAKAASGGQKTNPKLKLQAYPFTLRSDKTVDELVAEAESDPCVVRVQSDRKMILSVPTPGRDVHIDYVTNDPGLAYQQHLTFLKATKAWDVFYSVGRGISQDVLVAVVDTGIDYNHEDLKDNVFTDSDGQHGYDFENDDSDPIDDHGHGTHVAGLIAAVAGNGYGVTGVMGSYAKLLPVKVADSDGGAYPSSIANGIRFAVDNGAEVINVSLGMSGTNTAMRDAIQYAVDNGVVVLAAAGNESQEITTTNFSAPAGYSTTIPGLISVTSVSASNGSLSSFSNFSPTYVTIGAPGSGQILSTYPDNRYRTMEGTSMATPITSGAVALLVGYLKANDITYTPSQVVNLLLYGSRTDSSLSTKIKNGKILDLERLAKVIKLRYGVESDGGTENPFQ